MDENRKWNELAAVLIAIAVIVFIALGLQGCAGAEPTQAPAVDDAMEDSASCEQAGDGRICFYEITTSSGEEMECAVYTDYVFGGYGIGQSAGLSCDWPQPLTIEIYDLQPTPMTEPERPEIGEKTDPRDAVREHFTKMHGCENCKQIPLDAIEELRAASTLSSQNNMNVGRIHPSIIETLKNFNEIQD